MTIVINFFGGPGIGKSTMMAGLFYKLKNMHINVEMAPEFAKELVCQKSLNLLRNQLYVIAEQYKRIRILNDADVDIIVCDSPFLLGMIYDPNQCEVLKQLLFKKHDEFNNINYFIKRAKPFYQQGRVHTEEQSIQKDILIKEMLEKNDIPFTEIENSAEGLSTIIDKILKSTLDPPKPIRVVIAEDGYFKLSEKAYERLIELGCKTYKANKDTISLFDSDTEIIDFSTLHTSYEDVVRFDKYKFAFEFSRADSRLLQVVEEMGKEANGYRCKLKIVTLPIDVIKWYIKEYDHGNGEYICETHRTFP